MRRHPTMVTLVKEYLAYRRALGFALDVSGTLLLTFARFADRSGHRGPLTTDLALRWASRPETASARYRAERLSIVRGFARYLAARDGRSEVPDRRLLGVNHYRLQPHIYSQQQLGDLVRAAAELRATYRLRPLTYSTFFGLLASTGLRVSEALGLDKDHVDLAHGILRIEQTKFRKSRLPTGISQALRSCSRQPVNDSSGSPGKQREVAMKKANLELRRILLGPALQKYFCQYLIGQRNLSPETIKSYRDAFKLLIRFLEQSRRAKADGLCVIDLDASCILAFLADLERGRDNSARTRNVRLAAIRSFIRHVSSAEPLLLPMAQRLLAIPVKRFEHAVVGYLTREQMQGLLDAPDASTETGLRDRVLLMLMYNTGARVSEIAALRISDLHLESGGSVHIRGKGRKQRSVPLWRQTVRLLRQWLKQTDTSSDKPLLPNARGAFMTRAGVAQRLDRAVAIATARDPSLRKCHISPHTIRHTTAMHLLQSGVDLSVIAMWLGHESIQTTHQYLQADLEAKKKALASVESPRLPRSRLAATKPLMQFLEGL